MADITAPNIVNFLGDIRGVANSIYHSKAVWDDLGERYITQGIGSDLAALDDADVIMDGAVANGWEIATVADMENFMARVAQLKGVLDAEFAMDIINKLRTQALT